MNRKVPAPDLKNTPENLIAGRYEIRRAIGSGGAGAVFQAWDTQLQRFVAVKRWKPSEPLLDDPAGTERLWREAMTLAAIQHPNILTIHDFGVDAEGPYVITEYVDGETLDHVIQQGPFELSDFADAAQQTLEALIAAHQAGLIHRDLKPQNIMRLRLASGAWQYKILDFGLARFVTQPTLQSLEGNTSIYGSILYVAPEQLRHQPLDARTDIYAMGCLYYFMLSGRNAVEGDTVPALITSHLEHRVTPLSELRPDLPSALSDWVMKAMAFAPEDRFPSAVAALAALRKALPGALPQTAIRITPPVRPPAPTIVIPPPAFQTRPLPAQPPSSPGKKARGAWAAAGVLFLAAAGAILWQWLRPPPPVARPAPPPVTTMTSWRDESLPVEAVITAWPGSIAEARRPLIQRYFEQLRELDGPKWDNIGTVVEILATLQYNQRHNPAESRAYANLTYHDQAGRCLGEIDVVIWNVPAQRAEIAYEAVVSDQLNRKAGPSRYQIQRFANSIQAGQVAKIRYPYDPNLKFEPAQFAEAQMAIMGNQGALAAGFDVEVDITRFESDYLQRRLIDWRRARRTR